MRILILEDNKLTLKALQFSIERLGHHVTVAENGEQAINQLGGGNFDLLICDMMMPGISGLDFVSRLRSVEHSTIPVIMISSLHEPELIEAAFTAGANDYITKPFTDDDLSEAIGKFEMKPLGV